MRLETPILTFFHSSIKCELLPKSYYVTYNESFSLSFFENCKRKFFSQWFYLFFFVCKKKHLTSPFNLHAAPHYVHPKKHDNNIFYRTWYTKKKLLFSLYNIKADEKKIDLIIKRENLRKVNLLYIYTYRM